MSQDLDRYVFVDESTCDFDYKQLTHPLKIGIIHGIIMMEKMPQKTPMGYSAAYPTCAERIEPLVADEGVK